MKKLLKITGVLAVIFCLLLSLTGCGGNKLVGTFDDKDGKGKIVATFDKDDKLKSLVITMTYDSKDKAKEDYDSMKESKVEEFSFKRSGKKIIMTFDIDKFKEKLGNKDDALKKENIKKTLEKAYDCELK